MTHSFTTLAHCCPPWLVCEPDQNRHAVRANTITYPNPNLILEFEPWIKLNHKIIQLGADTLVQILGITFYPDFSMIAVKLKKLWNPAEIFQKCSLCLTNHKKDQNMHASHKTTNYIMVVVWGLDFLPLIDFSVIQHNNIPEINISGVYSFPSFTVVSERFCI